MDTWKGLGGPRFTWSVKAWRWRTHIKRLRGVAADLRGFLSRVTPLVSGGVVLFQLPPPFTQDLARLERFLRLLPFDNTADGHAFRNALTFQELTRHT